MPFPIHFADEPNHMFLQLGGEILWQAPVNGHSTLEDFAPFPLETFRDRRVMRSDGHSNAAP